MENVVINLSQKVKSHVREMKPSFLYQFHKTGKFFYDRERLQRLLQPWHAFKTNSYLSTLFNGASLKDCFQLASISTIVEWLETQMVPVAKNYRFIEENFIYFKKLQEQGYEYLVLDGQHRIDTIVRFFDNEIFFKPEEIIEYQIKGEKGTTDIEGKFNKLPEEIQDYLLNQIPLIVVLYETGDLRELARIFITSNSMTAMTKHEKRILNYNPVNRWLNQLCLYDTNIRSMFKNIGSGMAGEYSLDHKGDTLFVAEMLTYICDNKYEGYDTDILDDILGAYPTGKFKISEVDYDTTKKILRIMADGCAQYDAKKLKKFTKSSFYNLFYTLSFILQKGNIWGKKKDFDGQFKVVNEKEFVKWFFDEEFKRINAPGTKTPYKDAKGKTKYQVHDWSFAKHNSDQKHSRKESVQGDGGSKYTFDSWARVQYLLEDLCVNISNLQKLGIIAKVGSRTTMSRDELLVAHNVPLSQSDSLHLDEIIPVSKGGDRTLDNTRFVDAKTNLNDSNRIKAVA
jgi:hypothetical protein